MVAHNFSFTTETDYSVGLASLVIVVQKCAKNPQRPFATVSGYNVWGNFINLKCAKMFPRSHLMLPCANIWSL